MRNSVYYLTARVRVSRGGSGDTVNGSLSSASDARLVHLLEGGKKQQRQKKKREKKLIWTGTCGTLTQI